MGREKKKAEKEQADPEAEERRRLKKLTHTNNLLSGTPAKGYSPLSPSKTVIKHHGKDILKKSQRKNRYLFSFSGLLAPISGGKIGDLTDLGSKNPILYLDFPQGRMKLFGTIVYPKNRYLTLQFSRGGKNVMCEDCFDTMIVFSDACWVGKKEENPDEAKLDFPKELYEEKHAEFDFDGGAGATTMGSKDSKKVVTKSTEEESLSESAVDEMEVESPEKHASQKDVENSTPVRQSGRTAGKTFNFTEISSGEDSDESVSEMSGEVNNETAKSSKSRSVNLDPGNPERPVEMHDSENVAQAALPSLSSSGTKESFRGSLVQTTISTLFKKVEQKNTSGSSNIKASCKVSSEKRQLNSSELTNKKKAAKQKKVETTSQGKKSVARSERKKQKAEPTEVEDDIEESSSASEESEHIDESDEDWHS